MHVFCCQAKSFSIRTGKGALWYHKYILLASDKIISISQVFHKLKGNKMEETKQKTWNTKGIFPKVLLWLFNFILGHGPIFHPELCILVLVCSMSLVRPNATSQAEINSHLLKTWPLLDWAPVTVYFGSVTIVVFPFGFNSEPVWSKLILCSSYKPSGWKWKGTALKAMHGSVEKVFTCPLQWLWVVGQLENRTNSCLLPVFTHEKTKDNSCIPWTCIQKETIAIGASWDLQTLVMPW